MFRTFKNITSGLFAIFFITGCETIGEKYSGEYHCKCIRADWYISAPPETTYYNKTMIVEPGRKANSIIIDGYEHQIDFNEITGFVYTTDGSYILFRSDSIFDAILWHIGMGGGTDIDCKGKRWNLNCS